MSAPHRKPPGASTPFWQGLAKALQTEPRDDTTIRGATGLEHKVLQIAVDEKTDRLLVITAEPDPRMAALVQHDVQSTLSPKTRVLVARPLIVDLGVITRKLVEVIGRRAFRMSDLNRQINRMNSMPQAQRDAFTHSLLDEIAGPLGEVFKHAPLPPLSQILAFVQQAAHFDWPGTFKQAAGAKRPNPLISLDALTRIDTIAADVAAGVCPVPLYEFGGDDWELFQSGSDLDAMADRLRAMNIFQYFFPPPDQTALALIDRGLSDPDSIIGAVRSLPEMGHPIASPEILDQQTPLDDMIEALERRGFAAELEHTVTITEPGREVRSTVKAKPRESLITKLLNKIGLPDIHLHLPG
jgi:hypothetical protein